MRKIILALATAGALVGTALPALAWDDDDQGNDDQGYRYHRYYYGDYYRDYDRPYYRYHYRYHDYDDDWRRRSWHQSFRNWWWKHHHYDPDRPWVRKWYY
jgi:hypothetical protein